MLENTFHCNALPYSTTTNYSLKNDHRVESDSVNKISTHYKLLKRSIFFAR